MEAIVITMYVVFGLVVFNFMREDVEDMMEKKLKFSSFPRPWRIIIRLILLFLWPIIIIVLVFVFFGFICTVLFDFLKDIYKEIIK